MRTSAGRRGQTETSVPLLLLPRASVSMRAEEDAKEEDEEEAEEEADERDGGGAGMRFARKDPANTSREAVRGGLAHKRAGADGSAAISSAPLLPAPGRFLQAEVAAVAPACPPTSVRTPHQRPIPAPQKR